MADPTQNPARKLLTALDNPRILASTRRDLALYALGLSTGLIVAETVLWAAVAAGVGLWLLWRSQIKQAPKDKLAEALPPE